MSRSPIDVMLDGVDWRCSRCGVSATVGCTCWERCTCGWSGLPGEFCRNPKTTRCSSKVKYGRYDRKTKGWVPR